VKRRAPSDTKWGRRRRGDHNRLGFAVQLCYVRFRGQLLAVGDSRLCADPGHGGGSVKSPDGHLEFYAERDQTRRGTCWN
jgi:Domain of unknown function (DUF4158)